jgi:hypothetical protein
MVILPFLFALLMWVFWRRQGFGCRYAALLAAVCSAFVILLLTELLSALRLLAAGWLAAGWLIACVVCTAVVFRRGPFSLRSVLPDFSGLSFFEKLLLAGLVIVVAGVVLLAVLAPPNLWDAMEYHLPRVVVWISNRSVDTFPTPDYAQVTSTPFAEYSDLQLYLLGGGDRWIDLVEAFSFAGAICGVSLIAKRFGAGRRGQLLAGIFAATVPEAVLESSGSMTTQAGAFWMICSLALILAVSSEQGMPGKKRDNTILVLAAAAAAGFALLTKGTAYVILPFLLIGCLLALPAAARRAVIRRLGWAVLLVVVINGVEYGRLYRLTGSPLGSPFPAGGPMLHFKNDHVTVRGTLANTIRNLSLHFGTPSPRINAHVLATADAAIRLLGQNPNDPGTVWVKRPFFIVDSVTRNEINAGNPLHLLLILAAIAALLWRGLRDRKISPLLWFTASMVASYLLFSALLRWQQWGSRYQVVFFEIGGVLFALALERISRFWLAPAMAALLFIYCLPYLLTNELRSYIPRPGLAALTEPRSELYFADQHKGWYQNYSSIAQAVLASGCHDVAIDAYMPKPDSQLSTSPRSFYNYPLFALLHEGDGRLRVRYVNVVNITARYMRPQQLACVTICLDCAGHGEASLDGGTRMQTIGRSVIVTNQPLKP